MHPHVFAQALTIKARARTRSETYTHTGKETRLSTHTRIHATVTRAQKIIGFQKKQRQENKKYSSQGQWKPFATKNEFIEKHASEHTQAFRQTKNPLNLASAAKAQPKSMYGPALKLYKPFSCKRNDRELEAGSLRQPGFRRENSQSFLHSKLCSNVTIYKNIVFYSFQ